MVIHIVKLLLDILGEDARFDASLRNLLTMPMACQTYTKIKVKELKTDLWSSISSSCCLTWFMSLASSTRIISSSSSSGDLARSRVNIADDDLGEEKVPVDDGVDGAKKS